MVCMLCRVFFFLSLFCCPPLFSPLSVQLDSAGHSVLNSVFYHQINLFILGHCSSIVFHTIASHFHCLFYSLLCSIPVLSSRRLTNHESRRPSIPPSHSSSIRIFLLTLKPACFHFLYTISLSGHNSQFHIPVHFHNYRRRSIRESRVLSSCLSVCLFVVVVFHACSS